MSYSVQINENTTNTSTTRQNKTLTEFRKDGKVNLRYGVEYRLTGMAVTSDNRLLICNCLSNDPNVYIYKDYRTYEDEIRFSFSPCGITVVPCTDKAVVTLPTRAPYNSSTPPTMQRTRR